MFITVSNDNRQVVMRLNAQHPIFQWHFPGKPITPGVCQVQLLGELLELQTRRELELQRMVNLKFIHALSPENAFPLTVEFASVEPTGEGGVHAKGTITVNEQIATKFSLIFGARKALT